MSDRRSNFIAHGSSEDECDECDSDNYGDCQESGDRSHNIRRSEIDEDMQHKYTDLMIEIERAARRGSLAQAECSPKPSHVIPEHVYRQIGDLRFFADVKSASWKPAFKDLVSHAHSLNVYEIDAEEKASLREGWRKYCCEKSHASQKSLYKKGREGQWDRCVVCNTHEHSAMFAIDLCGNADRKTYNARDFLRDPDRWEQLFDKALKGYSAVHEPDWKPTDEHGMPKEFLGTFAIGTTCMNHLIAVLAAQNLPFNFMYSAMSALNDIADDNGGLVPESQQPTVTPERIRAWHKQRELIEYSVARGGKPGPLPTFEYDQAYWDRIEEAVNNNTLLKTSGVDAFETCGHWAAKNVDMNTQRMHAVSHSEDEQQQKRCARAQHPGDHRTSRGKERQQEERHKRRRLSRNVVFSESESEEQDSEDQDSEDQDSDKDDEHPAALNQEQGSSGLQRPRRAPPSHQRKWADGVKVVVRRARSLGASSLEAKVCDVVGYNTDTKRYQIKSDTGHCGWFYQHDLALYQPKAPALAPAPAPARRLSRVELPVAICQNSVPPEPTAWEPHRQREEARRAQSSTGLGEIYSLQAQRQNATGASSASAPPPVPDREARNPLNDIVSAASRMRSLVTGPSPTDRILRGYATTIKELFDLAGALTDNDMHTEAAAAGRGAVVMQELVAKWQHERAR